MSTETRSDETHELVRRMWSEYLHDERKYDKFGAQGKLLLACEVCAEMQESLPSVGELKELVNHAFPRTFFCFNPREISPQLRNTISKYLANLREEFSLQELPPNVIRHICVSETAEKFCINEGFLKDL